MQRQHDHKSLLFAGGAHEGELPPYLTMPNTVLHSRSIHYSGAITPDSTSNEPNQVMLRHGGCCGRAFVLKACLGELQGMVADGAQTK